jgi:hypothetical protein
MILQIDDELLPELTQIINQNKPKDDSNAYFYLLGFMAIPQHNPIKIGKSLYSSLHKQELENHLYPSANNYIEIPPFETIPVVESDLLCAYSSEECLSNIFNNTHEIATFVAENKMYISRFQKFISLSDFHTLSEPSINEVLPDYSVIVKAVRLYNLEQIYLSSLGQTSKAIDALFIIHHQLRSMLSQQDNLIGKLTSLSLLSENIDLIYLISNKYEILIKEHIPALNQQERDLTLSLSREVRMMNYLYQSLDKSTDIFSHTGQQGGFESPSWLTRVLFKPNMTSNQSTKHIYYYAQLSTFTIGEFDDEIHSKELMPSIQKNWFRNAIGTILSQIAGPDFSKYIVNFWNIDNKIQLFNANINQKNIDKKFDKVTNIYPSLEQYPAFYTETKEQVCLKSPLEDTSQYQCLRISIN